MAGMCCRVLGETETSATVEAGSKSARRRRLEIHRFKLVAADASIQTPETNRKRQKVEAVSLPVLPPREWKNAVRNIKINENQLAEDGKSESKNMNQYGSPSPSERIEGEVVSECPKFGMTSICGRRRDMEDAVAIHPSFCGRNDEIPSGLHFFGVYDGHGCSHVAMKCRDRMHEIVKDEFESKEASWNETMMESFSRMDKEVIECSRGATVSSAKCRCELQTPQCDAVGSTAVVSVVTPDKVIVSNCGDSRAVLSRNGVAIPLSSDHKPDRPDELSRIEEAGGRVIFWDGPRVLGVLAMSRAIGDNYLKPYVISEPEVTITDRTPGDECLILASDGLWDVVSNETACSIVRMCLQAQKPPSQPASSVGSSEAVHSFDKACWDASILLTKLALARRSTDNISVVVVDLRRNL
ncbi:unnamed protein product [Ilex paraguariensis]|uniref:protein-serine/threonine phosphatase n=1 Tax=Ilex paraguariensis TaxID=185542 RepID=A0ABC8T6F0_9AQUA